MSDDFDHDMEDAKAEMKQVMTYTDKQIELFQKAEDWKTYEVVRGLHVRTEGWKNRGIKRSDSEYRDALNNWLLSKMEKMEGGRDELKNFCIWLTGCGYDFTQHEYFIKQRDKLLKSTNKDASLTKAVDGTIKSLKNGTGQMGEALTNKDGK